MNLARIAFGAALSAFLVLSACETPAKVSVLQSATASITPGATYAWAPVAAPSQHGDPRIDNDIIRERIRTAVNTNLVAKGFQLVSDPESAQLLVAYYVGLQPRTDYRVDTFGGAYGYGYGWGMYGAPSNIDVRAINYVDGTLILDLKDRASGQLAWRATSEKRINEGDGAQEKINKLVAGMLTSLPGVGPTT